MPASNPRRLDQLEGELKAAAERRSPERLREKLRNGSYVYGAGNFGRRVVDLLRVQGFPCLGIIDRRAGTELTHIGELPVVHPDTLTPGIVKGHNFVLGIFNPHNDMGEIIRTARNYGFSEIFWGADLPDALGPTLSEFWLSGRQIFIEQFEQIRSLAGFLSDQTSMDTLESLIRFRALDGDNPTPAPNVDTQYLPPDLLRFDKPIAFLDGGAYNGDTFRSLKRFGVDIDHWLAFEPDPANFAQLVQFGQDCGTRATFIPCGLSDRLHQVQFEAGNTTSSRIPDGQSNTGMTIQCLAIDEVFADMPLDYIKLDIEGAESAALNGMTKTVQKHRPKLAISVYHRPEDLWQIPLQIMDMIPASRLYLRPHQYNSFETVAYALL